MIEYTFLPTKPKVLMADFEVAEFAAFVQHFPSVTRKDVCFISHRPYWENVLHIRGICFPPKDPPKNFTNIKIETQKVFVKFIKKKNGNWKSLHRTEIGTRFFSGFRAQSDQVTGFQTRFRIKMGMSSSLLRV